ncbi:MAG: DUF2490 domain-containing protein [Hyphomicrobium sp.]|nr:DUF2490 domain-containing protein [Hyphomicrobium sp.]
MLAASKPYWQDDMNLRFASVGVCLVSLLAQQCIAHADDDFQFWQTTNLSAKLDKELTGHLEVQPRFTDDASRLGQLLIRPSIGWGLGGGVVVSAGYAYVRTSPAGRTVTHEHRPWQQLAFPVTGQPGSFMLTSRSRIEQRVREDGNDLGHRFRQQVRMMVPLERTGWNVVAWSEVFLNLNDTDWGQRSGLDRWRNFIGVNIPISHVVSAEPGYLNQYVNSASGDISDHVLSMTLNVNF